MDVSGLEVSSLRMHWRRTLITDRLLSLSCFFCTVSGPESLQLTVRGAVRDWIDPSAVWHGEAKGDLTLHCESFGW